MDAVGLTEFIVHMLYNGVGGESWLPDGNGNSGRIYPETGCRIQNEEAPSDDDTLEVIGVVIA
jgi:hypothetical protein